MPKNQSRSQPKSEFLESLSFKTQVKTFQENNSTTFIKMLYVKEAATIRLCQVYSRCLPPSYRLDIHVRKVNFFNGLKYSTNSIPSLLASIIFHHGTMILLLYYTNRKVWEVFEFDLGA